jgi:hypothetical protein
LRSGHVDHLAQAGDELVAAGQKRAVVVNAAPSPEGGYDLLAVAQTAADGEALHLRTESGPAIRLSTLPS